MHNWTDSATNVNCFVESACKLDTSPLRTDRRASGNKGFKEIGGSVVNQAFVHLIKFGGRLTVHCSEIPNFLNPQNVSVHCKKTKQTTE
jgi:hypothetical protein